MRHSTIAAALFTLVPAFGPGSAFAADGPFTANVSLVTDYAYRGISQTDERPALQGGVDYAHDSGFYAGVWGTNVSWLRDAETSSSSGNSLELDVYGGYRTSVGALGVDVGLLQYFYPGDFDRSWRRDTGLSKPDTLEGYVGLSWEFLTFRYSHAFTDLFGTPGSDHSKYLDLTASHEVMPGLSLIAHVGRQVVTGPGDSYTDWKIGATKAVGDFTVGLHYVDTDLNGIDLAEERLILSLSRTF